MTRFTLCRAGAPGVHRDQIILEPNTTCDCTDPGWRNSLLVVEDGRVILSTAAGQIGFTPGAVFALGALAGPVLHNPGPTHATITRARRNHPPHPSSAESPA